MKKTLLNIGKAIGKLTFIAVLVVLAFGVLTAQYPSWQDVFVKIIHPSTKTSTAGVTIKNNAYSAYALLIKNSRGTTIFSVDSTGKPTGVGVALTGLSVLDSATIAGEFRQGGLVSYDQMFSIKNNAVNTKIIALYNSRGTLLAYVDSSGLFNADTLVIDENSRLGGLAAYGSRLSVKNNAVNDYLLSLYNSRGTKNFGIDSSGSIYGTTYLADTSAFTGTLASKAISIPGAAVSDIYVVSKRSIYGTSTDTPTDSCILSYMAKADSLIVLRQGTYAASGGSMPSGTKFSWIRIRRP